MSYRNQDIAQYPTHARAYGQRPVKKCMPKTDTDGFEATADGACPSNMHNIMTHTLY